jgi:hypothetical protein
MLHLISGMVGMVIVEPGDGFPGKVDTSFAIVQNEYYLKQNGSGYLADTASAGCFEALKVNVQTFSRYASLSLAV